MELTVKERIELSYFYFEGFRWIVRNEIGSTVVFKKKPVRHNSVRKNIGGGYDHWINQDNFPIKNWGMSHGLSKGNYSLIAWEDEPIEIFELLSDVDPKLALEIVTDEV